MGARDHLDTRSAPYIHRTTHNELRRLGVLGNCICMPAFDSLCKIGVWRKPSRMEMLRLYGNTRLFLDFVNN